MQCSLYGEHGTTRHETSIRGWVAKKFDISASTSCATGKPRLECDPTKGERKVRKGFDEYHVQYVIHLVRDRWKSVMDVDNVARLFWPSVWTAHFEADYP
jgi:hypothetical protein